MNHLALVAITLASFTACKKESRKDGAPSSEPTAAKTTDDKADAGPFGAWDMAARRAAFQGAHVGPGDSLGKWEAWNIEGSKITTWNGTRQGRTSGVSPG